MDRDFLLDATNLLHYHYKKSMTYFTSTVNKLYLTVYSGDLCSITYPNNTEGLYDFCKISVSNVAVHGFYSSLNIIHNMWSNLITTTNVTNISDVIANRITELEIANRILVIPTLRMMRRVLNDEIIDISVNLLRKYKILIAIVGVLLFVSLLICIYINYKGLRVKVCHLSAQIFI